MFVRRQRFVRTLAFVFSNRPSIIIARLDNLNFVILHPMAAASPELFHEIIALYLHHGWRLRRVLLRPETRDGFDARPSELLKNAGFREAEIDALWFARPSQAGREAWELRLVTEQPYALFEAFGTDETEEDREEVRREMEARMKEHAAK